MFPVRILFIKSILHIGLNFFQFFRNAYNVDCLAPYGGPIEAGVTYGGMPKPLPGKTPYQDLSEFDSIYLFISFAFKGANPEYILATGLAVTFMVTNKQNKDELGPAMEWEKKYKQLLLS